MLVVSFFCLTGSFPTPSAYGNMGHSNNHLIMDMISTHTLRTEGGEHSIHADANHHPISIRAPVLESD